ncbi:hypothetical protein [Rhodovulum sulfidophilum]|uniref:hypothetical protein n=1 Tax=Rhodovulum sulfidophilum TaxID=35806 RepID=UPI000950E1E7|nr:hypothetical protein [Rhodovulum sulfidophilum]MBL3550775.1 hypothetical protein [Rhodovulum sulfidophilum]OLS48558.1 hypothetical protein BV379_09985 [Rhodovulum sulfidophilum]
MTLLRNRASARVLAFGFWLALVCFLRVAAAEPVSLIGAGGLLQREGASGPLLTQMRGPLLGPGPEGAPGRVSGASGASLFAGRGGTSLFATYPVRAQQMAAPGTAAQFAPLRPGRGNAALAEGIRLLIGRAEAGRMDYDAVQHGAKIRPPGPPTRLTIAEIYKWIAETPGQPHAIGRYQFIPDTLRRLVAELGLDEKTRFSAPVQDRLADLLLEEAGLSAFGAGEMKREAFMHNLSRIWAGLPTASGRSYYHGVAGNRATMTWMQFEAAMSRIAPGPGGAPKDG